MERKTDKVYNKLIRIYNSSVKSLDEITLNIIEFYYSRYKYLELELETHIEKEPSKIFKKRLEVWIDRKKEIELEKRLLLDKIEEEIKELQK